MSYDIKVIHKSTSRNKYITKQEIKACYYSKQHYQPSSVGLSMSVTTACIKLIDTDSEQTCPLYGPGKKMNV